MQISKGIINNIEVLTVENDYIKCIVVPALGGKITSLYNKMLQQEFLWSNENLSFALLDSGADYDSNFLGGIDELIPNDIPENIDGIDYPDHGELWTTSLDYEIADDKLVLTGKLKLSGLAYRKTIWLDAGSPSVCLDYHIKNESSSTRNFLWKLHAALKVEAGDELLTSAGKAKVVDVEYSRFSHTDEFDWPTIEDANASIVPAKNNTMDFFYLYDTPVAEMKLLSNNRKHVFAYSYDKKIFPYQWYFASYGGFLNHYTVILEPCTSMPLSVNDAKQLNQCAVLQPGEELNTTVKIYAGNA